MDERLAPLQDIALPPLPGLWPPAPGWWLLGGLLLAAAVAGWWLHRRRHAPRRVALLRLEVLARGWHADRNGAALAAGISELLRRVALLHHRRETVAGLAGAAWPAFLAEHGGVAVAELAPLADAPYRPAAEVDGTFDGDALIAAARRWIGSQPW